MQTSENSISTNSTVKRPVVLQVLPELQSGGVERGTIEIARAICKAGGVALIASQGGPMVSQLNNSGAKHITLPMKTKNPFKIWANARKLVKLIEEHKVDIVHARSRAPAWSAYIACKRTKCKFVTTFHGTYGLKGMGKKKYNSVMTKGDRVIAISNFISDHIQRHYPIETNRMNVIHRGVDLRLFNPFTHSPQRMIELSKEWRLPEELPLVLFPGRITRWKGQDLFLRALGRLPHRNFFAVILGDDKGHETYRKELEALIVELGLEGHVRLARHTRYVSEAYMLSRVIVSTSIEPEAFGRVVLEAQAMGKPVIASNQGGPQETVIHDVTGWLIPERNTEMLSIYIDHALTLDDETLHWMAEQAVINARHFSLEMMCHNTLGVYADLLPDGIRFAQLPLTSPASSQEAAEHAA